MNEELRIAGPTDQNSLEIMKFESLKDISVMITWILFWFVLKTPLFKAVYLCYYIIAMIKKVVL